MADQRDRLSACASPVSSTSCAVHSYSFTSLTEDFISAQRKLGSKSYLFSSGTSWSTPLQYTVEYRTATKPEPANMGAPSTNAAQWLFHVSEFVEQTPSRITSSIPVERELYDRARGVEFLFRLGVSSQCSYEAIVSRLIGSPVTSASRTHVVFRHARGVAKRTQIKLTNSSASTYSNICTSRHVPQLVTSKRTASLRWYVPPSIVRCQLLIPHHRTNWGIDTYHARVRKELDLHISVYGTAKFSFPSPRA